MNDKSLLPKRQCFSHVWSCGMDCILSHELVFRKIIPKLLEIREKFLNLSPLSFQQKNCNPLKKAENPGFPLPTYRTQYLTD